MDGTPQRPAAVPDDAVWVAEAGEWRQGALDAAGEKQGRHRTWRPDGSLREDFSFVDGRGVGAYRRFHPNGQVAGQGELVDGNLQGTLRAFASDAATPERLQSCCVPPNAWELQTDYDCGQLMARRWYDRGGQQILDSGAPHPPRPASVPADARYDEASARWLVGGFDVSAGARAHWLRWSRAGVLVEEEELLDSARHGVWKQFRESDGARCLEANYRQGRKHGAYYDGTIGSGSYDDGRVVAEEGQFEGDLALGVWRLRDAAGAVIAERDLGVAVDDAALVASPALAAVGGAPDAAARTLIELAGVLRGERRPGEAILAVARAAALTGDPATLRAWLRELTWTRPSAVAEQLAAVAVERAGDRLAPSVEAILRGGAPVILLRALASALKDGYRVALQLVDAALLLTPDHASCLVTRALVNVYLGAPEAAARDAARLPAGWEEQRDHLVIYLRILFPTFDFWPARIPVATMFQDFPEAPAQSLAAIRAAVGKLATRLGMIRAALQRQLEENRGEGRCDSRDGGAGEACWLPPALPALLPEGPLALEIRTFEQSFEPEQGQGGDQGGDEVAPVVETISVDERPAIEATTIPGLLRLARRDWAALTWICWSCGLGDVALPESLVPPETFGPAAGMAIERAWRCRDKLTTGGLVAMGRGVPGFSWEGIAIDDMPRALVEVMADEHFEVRAMFLWLCDESTQSPWQDDLRTPD
jgi:antitoxin component YwqK of YwqJK toxin-antitoxin module